MSEYKNYKDLKIYQISRELAIEIHKMSLSLPKFELYEEGSQIRRSSKSIISNIVEGYGRRNYKNDFIRFITFAIPECDETQVHLDFLYNTGSMPNKDLFDTLSDKYKTLGKMLNGFLDAIIKKHLSEK
jgi:four helix bundle protein